MYIILIVYATCSIASLLMLLDSSLNPLPNGTPYVTDDQSFGTPVLQCTEWDVNQIRAADPFLNPNEGPQVSSPAAVQPPGQPQVPGAPGLDPMLSSGSGVGQPMPNGHTEELGWTGTIFLNGIRVHTRALATEAARNPCVLLRNFY